MLLNILKNKYYLATFGVIALLICGMVLSQGSVTTHDVLWECNRQACRVRFTVKNSTHDSSDYKGVVRAYRYRSLGKGATVSDLVGEKTIDFSLFTGETRSFDEIVALNAKGHVDLVSVSAYKPR
jgi:hypothetical protein